jgi:hypothetical protein
LRFVDFALPDLRGISIFVPFAIFVFSILVLPTFVLPIIVFPATQR